MISGYAISAAAISDISGSDYQPELLEFTFTIPVYTPELLEFGFTIPVGNYTPQLISVKFTIPVITNADSVVVDSEFPETPAYGVY